ncbi:MAG: hypothetical protein GXY44_13065 [Phycisphaerales bacterium]|nr:hypothetical protein [Phycisphaerales bacterium]
MSYAIDLSERQSVRTLEQAARHGVEVRLHPRSQQGYPPILCHLITDDQSKTFGLPRSFLVVVVTQASDQTEMPEAPEPLWDREDYLSLAGTYCDAEFQLSGHHYLFSTDVANVEIDAEQERVVFWLTRPAIIQVAQRRAYRRIRLAQSSQVNLKWAEDDHGMSSGIGWLCNISKAGLACRTEPPIADRLCIGEPLQVEFAFSPETPERFQFDAVLCSKTPAGTQGKIILGIQFLFGPGHESSARSAEALKRHLADWYARIPSYREGSET